MLLGTLDFRWVVVVVVSSFEGRCEIDCKGVKLCEVLCDVRFGLKDRLGFELLANVGGLLWIGC